MLGFLVPPDMLSAVEPAWMSLVSAPLTVHFVHRWFAIVVLVLALWLAFVARRELSGPRVVRAASALAAIIIAQVALGVAVVVFGVPVSLALTHQGMGVAVFALAVYLNIVID